MIILRLVYCAVGLSWNDAAKQAQFVVYFLLTLKERKRSVELREMVGLVPVGMMI